MTVPDAGLSLPDELESRAGRLFTPCGSGRMAWRSWGEGLPVVLLHGGFGSWKHWARNVGALAAQFNVLAGDLPGLGSSDPAPPPHDAPNLGCIVAAGINQLLGPEQPLILAGFSLGSVIGAHAAQLLGPRVTRVFLFGPSALGPHWRNQTDQLIRRPRDATREREREIVRYNLSRSMIADPRRIDDLAIDIQAALVRQKRHLLGMPISSSTALLDILPSIAARTHIVYGERDFYCNPDAATCLDMLAEEFPGLTTTMVPGAGHWVNYEAADVVNRLLLRMSREPSAEFLIE